MRARSHIVPAALLAEFGGTFRCGSREGAGAATFHFGAGAPGRVSAERKKRWARRRCLEMWAVHGNLLRGGIPGVGTEETQCACGWRARLRLQWEDALGMQAETQRGV